MNPSSVPETCRLSVDDYHRMGEVGILPPDCRVELIDGELVRVTPVGAPHFRVVNRLTNLLLRCVGDAAVVSVQGPVRLSACSEPQPDVVVLEPGAIAPGADLPKADAVLLLIEESDAALPYDRDLKERLCARVGIRECWIGNSTVRRVEVNRKPEGEGYAVRRILEDGQAVAAQAPAEIVLSTDWLFA